MLINPMRCAAVAISGFMLVALSRPPLAYGCTTAESDAAAATCAAQVGLSRLDGLAVYDPAPGRLETRMDGKPWISGDWTTVPFAVTPTDQNVTVRTSLGHWAAFSEAQTMRKFEEAKALAPAGLPMPKAPIGVRPPLDMWSTIQVLGAADDTQQGLTGGVGADVTVGRGTLLGVAAALRDPTSSSVATYFAVNPLPAITLKGKAQWGETHGALEGSETMVSAELHGAWTFGHMKFAPMVAIADGKGSVIDDLGSHAVESRTVTVAPKISRPIPLHRGQILEPFLTFKNEIDIQAHGDDMEPGARSTDAKQSAGAGVNLTQPGSYALSVTTDLENIGSADESSVKSRLQLKVPLQ